MTANEFAAECVERTLSPELVLEDPEIRLALKERDDNKVIELLNTKF